jgi:hypothetical protein
VALGYLLFGVGCLVFGLVNRGAPGAADVTEPALDTEHADTPPGADVEPVDAEPVDAEPVDAEPVDAKPVPTPRSAADTPQQAT